MDEEIELMIASVIMAATIGLLVLLVWSWGGA